MSLLALALPLLVPVAHAVEGMWEPDQLPALAAPLAAAGFPGDPAALARLDQAPLGAIVSLGGCTASFVSNDGLLVTNHHCVVGDLQQAQLPGEDLVATGFYAPTRADERSSGPGKTVSITESIVDVTGAIVGKLPAKLSDLDRKARIDDATKKTVASCEKANPGRRCRVASYYEGLRYSLITQVELRDVRVVMAPPDSVGNYGDEIDNWHWPRHSGDFGFLRAYVGPDGKPADYAAGNVPYRPAHALSVEAAGVDPGGFVMVAGYPGRTERWQTGLELERSATVGMPRRIARSEWLLALYADMVKLDPSAEPLLNVSRSYVSNGLFNNKGALVGFTRSGVVQTANARDAALDAWVAADPARTAKYASAIAELRTVLTRRDGTRDRDEVMGWLGRSDLLNASRTILRVAKEREKPDAKREIGFQDRDLPRVKARLVSVQKGLHVETEKRYLTKLLLDAATLPVDQQVPELMAWLGLPTAGAPEAAVDAAVARLFTDSAVDTVTEREALFSAKTATITAATDGFLSLATALWSYDEARRTDGKTDAGAISRLRPVYADALRQLDPARSYADANGTLRVTFGTVQGYDGRDAVRYLPQTRLEGIVEKAGAWPFDAPPALLAAINEGKRGPYVDTKLGSVPVDFLSDLDITGGNSGSPTLDAKGHLVGLAFDGNYEGIASDWLFDPVMARTIHVDVRYVLYYLDAVANADALLTELGVTPAL
jgi:hypothetical protein